MNKSAAVVGGVLVVIMATGANLFYPGTISGYSFAGFAGSPLARLVSRLVTDRADDAFHGGATHDVRFRPATIPGEILLKIAISRGIQGAKERHQSTDQVKRSYSRDVGRWVKIARKLDPGNFDALLTDCNYIFEGGFDVELGDANGESEAGSPGGTQGEEKETRTISPSEVSKRKKNVAAAVREYLKKTPLTDKTAWYCAVAAAHMLHEVEPSHFGWRRKNQLLKLEGLGRMLIFEGDKCGEVWGGEADMEASRQFARALQFNLSEVMAESSDNNIPKNTLFKTPNIP